MKKYILVNQTSTIKTQVYPIPKDVICKTEYISGLEQEIIVTTNIFDSIEDADKVRQSIYLGNETLTIHPVEVNPEDILSRDYVSKRFWNGKKITGWADESNPQDDSYYEKPMNLMIDKPKVLGWVIYDPKLNAVHSNEQIRNKMGMVGKWSVCYGNGDTLPNIVPVNTNSMIFDSYAKACQGLSICQSTMGGSYESCVVVGLIEKI